MVIMCLGLPSTRSPPKASSSHRTLRPNAAWPTGSADKELPPTLSLRFRLVAPGAREDLLQGGEHPAAGRRRITAEQRAGTQVPDERDAGAPGDREDGVGGSRGAAQQPAQGRDAP